MEDGGFVLGGGERCLRAATTATPSARVHTRPGTFRFLAYFSFGSVWLRSLVILFDHMCVCVYAARAIFVPDGYETNDM